LFLATVDLEITFMAYTVLVFSSDTRYTVEKAPMPAEFTRMKKGFTGYGV
jgi:hypothetical protein